LESLGSFLVLATALASVLSVVVGKGKVNSGLTGILLVYVSNVSGAFGWAVRSASDVESNITSVERVLGYTHLTPEAPYEIEENKPASSWPQEGAITFKNYTAKYRPELKPSLNDINLHVKGGDNVGICGRTGAGKSSVTLALFRILEPFAGQIFIDGVDITTIGLADLRHKVTIVPQSPQMFEGSIRENIDPIGEHEDADIWAALEKSYLKEFVKEQPGGLDAPVSEGGSNLSSGQKQLFCFARALLRKTRILVLDEVSRALIC
jgi:ATP-binding cassette subfamily C (CFTR/MRP) protein 1